LCNVEKTEFQVAIKSIDLEAAKMNGINFDEISSGVKVMKDIDSPYVVKLIDTQLFQGHF